MNLCYFEWQHDWIMVNNRTGYTQDRVCRKCNKVDLSYTEYSKSILKYLKDQGLESSYIKTYEKAKKEYWRD